ncbi:M81 family metallopeptidase [Bacilliculturomica massiliensis]|uniref:M81 family metallopeptidase n=1 Tax=Bacilliculturomica massiliensis TaxID=1917867 RepID=UPI00103239E3
MFCIAWSRRRRGNSRSGSFLLSEIRTIVGNDMPVTISLDLHGNISEEIVRLSDGIAPPA